MSSEWDRGVLNASSWHGLEEVGTFAEPGSLLAHGLRTGAYPVSLTSEKLTTPGGLVARETAFVGAYQNHPARILGVNGKRYTATTPAEWASLISAAEQAGAKPTGAFSLAGGSRVIATFEIGTANGLVTNLLLADSFDGSMRLTGGTCSIRPVCANTVSAAISQDGEGMAQLLHTRSLGEKIEALRAGIDAGIKRGEKIKATYKAATETLLDKNQAAAILDSLFPEAEKGASKAEQTKAENVRNDARRVAALPINHVGGTGNLATIWNAATYLVDRNANGTHRKARGGADSLDSLLFGSRAKRIQEIQHTIEVVLADGSIGRRVAADLIESGAVDPRSVAKQVLADMLG